MAIALSIGWLSQRTFKIPPALYPSIKRIHTDGRTFTPLSQCECFPIVGNVNICRSIIVLLFFCRPPAILWTIWTIIIDSIQAATIWFVTHVSIKIRERFPSFAYFYSSTPIIWVRWMILVFTSSFHARPNVIYGRSVHAMFIARFFPVLCGDFRGKTTTRTSSAGLKFCTKNNFCVSAVTLATPKYQTSFVSTNRAKSNKTAEAFSSNVFRSGTKGDILRIVHEVTSFVGHASGGCYHAGALCLMPLLYPDKGAKTNA